MCKRKAKIITISFIILTIFIFFINNNFAVNSNENKDEVTNWKVELISDTKEIKNTQEINFKVEDNPNIVNGKIAPGSKAVANIEINIIKDNVPADISIKVDDINLPKPLKIITKIEDNNYKTNTNRIISLEKDSSFISTNGKIYLTVELEWKNEDKNNYTDTEIGTNGGTITVPITVEVKQHIVS